MVKTLLRSLNSRKVKGLRYSLGLHSSYTMQVQYDAEAISGKPTYVETNQIDSKKAIGFHKEYFLVLFCQDHLIAKLA